MKERSEEQSPGQKSVLGTGTAQDSTGERIRDIVAQPPDVVVSTRESV